MTLVDPLGFKDKINLPVFIMAIFTVSNSFAFEAHIEESGITKIEAQPISFQQAHLCPHPIELKVHVYNELHISGLKKFSYRWVLNGEIIENNGRFEAYPSSYGSGYDIQKKIIHVGNDPANVQSEYKENNPGINKLVKFFSEENLPETGWYQFFVLPAGETNWADAVKSNKATYDIQCRS